MQMIYFDFFGVLSTPVYWTVIQKFLPVAEHEAWFKKLDLLDTGALSEAELVTQIAEKGDVHSDVIWEAVSNAPKLNIELLDYIAEQLVGNHRVGLLTNVPRGLLERILQNRLQIFDPALVSSDLGLVKPDPAIFQQAIERAECRPEQILFIDDSEKNVIAARSLGINAILYTDNGSIIAQLPNG